MDHAVTEDPFLAWRKRRQKGETIREVVTHTQQTDLAEEDRQQIGIIGQTVLAVEQRVTRVEDAIDRQETRGKAMSELTNMVMSMTGLADQLANETANGLAATNDRFDALAGHVRTLAERVDTILSGQSDLAKGVDQLMSQTLASKTLAPEAPVSHEPAYNEAMPKFLKPKGDAGVQEEN